MAEFSFDDLDSDGNRTHNEKAIWEVGFDNEKDLLRWLVTELEDLEKDNESRIMDIRKNIALYKGVHYHSQEARTSRRDREDTTSKYRQKVVVNHLYDLTEQKVSKTVKYKPDVVVLPVKDESEDRFSAKVAKNVFDHISDKEEFDDKVQDSVRLAVITGEAYIFIEWDADQGDPIEAMNKLGDDDEMPLMDEEGNPLKDKLGKELKYSKKEGTVRIGDVVYKVVPPNYVLVGKSRKYEDAQILFRKEIVEVALLKKRYKSKADKIKKNKEDTFFNISTFEDEKLVRHTYLYNCYVKHSDQVNKGRCIRFTKDVILYNKDLGYTHGDFPCERLVDIMIPDQLHGVSSFSQVSGLQAHHNNLVSMEVRNQYMLAHPKIAVPLGSVKLESLGNDITIVNYKGAVPPQVLQFNPTSNQTTELANRMKEYMQVIFGIQGVSRGEPPPGVKAGIALQFLSEQEQERQSAFIAQYNTFVRRIAEKTISVAADYYTEDDNRMVRVLGKNNEYMSESLDAKHLTKGFDIRVQNSSALPRSKPARTQQILDLTEAYPGIFSKEQILDMLELGNVTRLYDQSTSASRAAEKAFEDMVDGDMEEVPPPLEWQDHLNWWRVFASRIQDISFMRLAEDRRQMILDHLEAREMLMVEKTKTSPGYDAKLSELVGFPMLFKLPEIAPPPMAPEEMPPMAPEEMPPMAPEEMPEMAGQQAQPIQMAQMEATPLEVAPQAPPIQPGI